MTTLAERPLQMEDEARQIQDEQELVWIDAAAAGDEEAFEALYTNYQPRVMSYLTSRLNNVDRSRIEDLTQDVMTKVLVGALNRVHEEAGFRGGIGRYLFGAASNILKDTYRRDQIVRYSELKPELDTTERYDSSSRSASVEDTVVSKAYLEYVIEVMRQNMSETDVNCILDFANGDSYAEIAEKQGISEGYLKKRMNNARVALRDLHRTGKLDGVPKDATFGLRAS
jgi:RNA polymerase sigma-70 factor (ECF subfamily)